MDKGESSKKNFLFKIYFFIAVISLALIGVLIGFIFTELEKNYPLYFKNHLWTTILLVIITLISTIIIHELSHLAMFLKVGFKIRLFALGPVLLIKELSGWSLKFKFNPSIGIGGMVLPNIIELKTQGQFNRVRNDYAKGMLVAPVVSAIQGILSFLCIFILSKTVKEEFQSTAFTIFISSFFTCLYINITSVINIGGVVGDYKAYKLFRKDDGFAAYQLYSYAMLSTEKQNARENCDRAKEIMEITLEENFRRGVLDSLSCLMIDTFLYEYLSNDTPMPIVIEKYIYYYLDNIKKYQSFLIIESYYILLIHILLYISDKDIENSRLVWESIKSKIPKNKVGRYYTNQIETKLYYDEKKECLLRNEKIVISSIDSIMNIFENYYEDELKILNRRIKPLA